MAVSGGPRRPRTPGSRLANLIAVGLTAILLTALLLPVLPMLTVVRSDVPAPHTVPVTPGGTSLRLAMLHDVFIDRGERRSAAWHEARLAKRLATIAAAGDAAPTPAVLDAYDDAAVSCDVLHRFAAGETLMRRKLALLAQPDPEPEAIATALDLLYSPMAEVRLAVQGEPLPPEHAPRYRAEANLATLIIHDALSRRASAEPAATIARLEEGRRHLLIALTLHPAAHFGRETWQLVAVDWVLATLRDPGLLDRFDLLGRPLAGEADAKPARLTTRRRLEARSPIRRGDTLTPEQEHALDPLQRAWVRSAIAPLTPDPAWVAAVGARYGIAVPFDEPALALVGMWWFGGGPNPQTALAMAGICERIGQRRLAWEGYAAALALADRFPGDDARRERFRSSCRARQAALAPDLGGQTALEATYATDVAAAHAEREALHRFEAERLASGADVDDPAWLAAWRAQHGPLATAPGAEDWVRVRRPMTGAELGTAALLAGAGVLLLVTAGVMVRGWWRHRRHPPDAGLPAA